MTFRRGSKLDPSQVEDMRGRIGGRGLAVGGGGLGVLLLLVYSLITGGAPSASDAQALDQLLNQTIGGSGPTASSALGTDCQTGADANARDDCRIVGYVNSIQAYWTDAFAASRKQYQPARTRFFTDVVDTGCGTATTAVGPFYCPADRFIYIDLGFFDELRTQFGAQGGPFAQAYVLAHEYGHHVQDLLGVLDAGSGGQGATGQSVRTELQADCYAGVWSANAVDTGYLEPLTQANIADALDAAAAVGDDRIQAETRGQRQPRNRGPMARPPSASTGSPTGYSAANAGGCDTFSGSV